MTSEMVLLVLLLVAGLVLLDVVTTRRFKRDEETLVLYRFGRTSKKSIRGTWTAAADLQYEFGDYVYFTLAPLIDRAVRVTGETARAWMGVRDALPFGVAVDRSAPDASQGRWTVRAHGWDWDANPPMPIEVEGSGLTEVTALDDLSARLQDRRPRNR